jgi:hypothetical protein
MLVGNLLMHAEYKRRWRAVKDLRDVYVRFNQAEAWYDRYNVYQNPRLLAKWLEYLHVLNLEQFDSDLCKAMLNANKRYPELSPAAIQRDGAVAYCYRGMKDMFFVDGIASPPHFVTGNKMRFEKVADLLNFLFLWDDGEDRLGWASKPYRAILQKSFELIERRLGYRKAERWLDEFFHLVRLTHWVLPYPSNAALIASTKTSRRQGLKRRMMWFSAVYADPDKVELPFQSMPHTLSTLLWNARRETFGERENGQGWGTSELISACKTQGIRIYGQEEAKEYWVAGKRSVGKKGFKPVWERSRPPKIMMLEQIRNKGLDELDELMVELTRDQGGEGENGGIEDARGDDDDDGEGEGEVGGDYHAPLRRSIREIFTRQVGANSGRSDECDETISKCTTGSSGSLFVPSLSGS